MKTLMALVTIMALVSGCAALLPKGTTTVEVPLPVYCNPPHVASPSRPIDALSDQADSFEFDKALWATVETLEGYTALLEASIEACRKP